MIDGVDGGDWMVGLREETGQKVEEVTAPFSTETWLAGSYCSEW